MLLLTVLDVSVNVKQSGGMDVATRAVKNAGEARHSIGEMCEAFAVTARALRFYEDEGLIAPERRGTARFYSDRDRARLTWILRGKRVGFSLAEIRELLDLYDLGDHRETQRRMTIERCRQRIAALRRQKDDIDHTIAELEEFVARIGGTVDDGPEGPSTASGGPAPRSGDDLSDQKE